MKKLANKKQMGGSAKPTPAKPINIKDVKDKAKYNPNLDNKKKAEENKYTIKNPRPYTPTVAKKGGIVKSKSKK